MTIVEALEHHRDACTTCRLGNVCVVARELIDRLADRFVPPSAPEVLDLDDHEKTCSACTPKLLCEIGQRIANEGLRTLFAAAEDNHKFGKA